MISSSLRPIALSSPQSQNTAGGSAALKASTANSFSSFQAQPSPDTHSASPRFGFEPISTSAAALGVLGHGAAIVGGVLGGILATVKGCFCFCGCFLPVLGATALLAAAALGRGKKGV